MQEPDTSPSVEIFCCYAREDLALFRHLEQHLATFKRERLATLWADVYLSAGTAWEEVIHEHLYSAQIILLLISPAFVSSDACFGEMDKALEQERQGKTQVIPILLRPVNWEQTPFSKLQMLPQGAKPVESQYWLNRDEALEEVVKGIRQVIKALLDEQERRHQAALAGQERRTKQAKQVLAIWTRIWLLTSSSHHPLRLRQFCALSLLSILLGGIVFGIASWHMYLRQQQTFATATTIAPQSIAAYNTAIARQGIGSGFDASNSHNNPYEHILSPQTVDELKLSWTTSTVGFLGSSPVVANGVVYIGSFAGKLYAVSASGCGRSTCSPLWVAPTGGKDTSSPAVANGFVFVDSDDHKLYAFSTTCNFSICSPLWSSSSIDGVDGTVSPTVANGVVYIHSGKLYAFSANGCGHFTCSPLWSSSVDAGLNSSLAVANSIVYIGSADGKLYAFSADGCGHSTCPSLWIAITDGGKIASSPAVANGIVYIGFDDDKIGSTDGKFYAFSANGCGHFTCFPLWSSSVYIVLTSSPAIANGVVFVYASGDKLNDQLVAFSANGCGFSTCSPLWSTSTDGWGLSSPTIANGLVFINANEKLDAFSTNGCGHSSCSSLWSSSVNDAFFSSPAIANGVVYVCSGNKLYAFAL